MEDKNSPKVWNLGLNYKKKVDFVKITSFVDLFQQIQKNTSIFTDMSQHLSQQYLEITSRFGQAFDEVSKKLKLDNTDELRAII